MKVFHVTRESDLESIMRQGLFPRTGERSELLGEPVPAIYAFPDKDALENAMLNWLGQEYEEYDGDLVYLEIETDITFKKDVEWEVIFYDPIPVQDIKNVYSEDWKRVGVSRKLGSP